MHEQMEKAATDAERRALATGAEAQVALLRQIEDRIRKVRTNLSEWDAALPALPDSLSPRLADERRPG